jgi:phosphopantetheinyl transferase
VNRVPIKLSPQTGSETAAVIERAQGSIDVWHANLQQTGWRRLLHLLSDEERHRAEAFGSDRDARRFIVSRAVLRSLLSGVIGIPASELKFLKGPNGKPALEPGICQPVHFSLSRSEELVLIGFAPRPLGVDVEWLDRPMDIEPLVDLTLSPREQKDLRRLDPIARREAFLQRWTLKEAYCKAIGTGLSVPPTMIELCHGPGQPLRLQSLFGNERVALCWCVALFVPFKGYIGAIAIRNGPWRMRLQSFDTCSVPFNAEASI